MFSDGFAWLNISFISRLCTNQLVEQRSDLIIYFKFRIQIGSLQNWCIAALRGKLTLLCSLALSSIKLKCLKLVLEKLHNHVAFIYWRLIFSHFPHHPCGVLSYSHLQMCFSTGTITRLARLWTALWWRLDNVLRSTKLMSSVTLMHPKPNSDHFF